MKKEKNKVGRPKLADKKLKKKAILMCLISIVLVIILTLTGSVTTLSVDTNRLKAAATTKEICEKIKLEDVDICKITINEGASKVIWHCNENYVLGSFRVCSGKDVSNCPTEIVSGYIGTNADCGTWAIPVNDLKKGESYFASATVWYIPPNINVFPYYYGDINSKPQLYNPSNTTNKKNDTCSLGIESKNAQNAVVYWDCKGNAIPEKIYLDGVEDTIQEGLATVGKANFDKLSAGKRYKVILEYNNGSAQKAHYKFTADKSETEKYTNVSGITNEANRKSAKSGFGQNTVDSDVDIKPGSGLECDNDLKTLIEKYWGWIMILGPIGLMVLISIDFVKAVVSSDADMLKKSGLAAFKRTLALVILLLTPFILNLILGWFGINLCF